MGRRRQLLRWAKYVLIVGCILLFDSLIYEPYSLKITSYHLSNAQLSGIKIVFATDFHVAPYPWEKMRLRKIIEVINEQNADLVVLGGDYVNRHSRKSTLSPEEIVAALQNITAPKVAVLGNHDSYYSKQEVKEALENAKILVLDNQNIAINLKTKKVFVAGVADYNTDKPDVAKALENAHRPIILVTHSPDAFLWHIDESADVVLAGHTHGGQIVLPLFGPLLVPSDYGRQYVSGLFYRNKIPLIVSSGLGTSLLPLRFNNRPEIVAVIFD